MEFVEVQGKMKPKNGQGFPLLDGQDITPNSITESKLAPDLRDKVNNPPVPALPDDSITESKLAPGLRDKVNNPPAPTLPDDSITESKLAPVLRDKVNNPALSIPNQSITSEKLALESVTSAIIAFGAVTSANILVGTVSNSNLSNDSVSANKIQNNAITEAKILNNAVTGDKIANVASTKTKLQTILEMPPNGTGVGKRAFMYSSVSAGVPIVINHNMQRFGLWLLALASSGASLPITFTWIPLSNNSVEVTPQQSFSGSVSINIFA